MAFLSGMPGASRAFGAEGSAKFLPPEGKRLLIVGQDLNAVGGLAAPFNNGYTDHLKHIPAGITTYTSLPRLTGLDRLIDVGAGPLWARAILAAPAYRHTALIIGLHLEQLDAIASGKADHAIGQLAKWLRGARRPVFLRIGYECDGSWNSYGPTTYQEAFRRIVDLLRQQGVNNCAYVWQVATSPYNEEKRASQEWYPGDDYVDWIGFSWFLNTPEQFALTDALLEMAKIHNKPVMCCECAPQGYDTLNLTRRDIIGGTNPRPQTAEAIWNDWYRPLFQYLEKNRQQIRAVAYINADWDSQFMWGPPYANGYWGDTRIQNHPYIQQLWLETINDSSWLAASPDLFEDIGFSGEAETD